MGNSFPHGRPHPALLLVGPTGSGKTPLGERLAAAGIAGRRCAHFDFGAELRRAASPREGKGLDATDRARIRSVLAEGRLLEPGEFPLAERLLGAFLERAAVARRDLLILNGLPRHVEQARALAPYLRLEGVIELRCPAGVVFARILRNTGGDRAGRADDQREAVAARLSLYERQTRPLLAFYRARGIPIRPLDVGADTTPGQMYAELTARR